MYSKKFTLYDLFYNPDLKGVLPQARIRTKELELTSEKKVRTIEKVSFDDYLDQIISIATKTAKKTMKNVKVNTNAYMVALIKGTLRKGCYITNTYNDVYMTLRNNAYMVSFFYTNREKIAKCMLESEIILGANREKNRLYLRINSLEEIKGFDRMEMAKFLKDVMENLYFNDNFIKTENAFDRLKLEKSMFIKNARNQMSSWANLKREFDRKVGRK